MFDFLIKNGHLIDTVLDIDEVADIAIKGDRIAAVGLLSEKDAVRVIDAKGCYVVPGLIDYHLHVNYGSTDIGFKAEVGCFPCGVTTAVDGGSCGVSNFETFYNNIVASSLVTLKTAINVCSGGQTSIRIPEDVNPDIIEEERILRLCEKYKDNIVGIKLRQGRPMVRDYGIKALEKSVKVARAAKLPLTVHMIDSPVSARETLELLGPGDIYCHVFHETGTGTILDENGRIFPEVIEAQKRGVLFDVSHGRGGATFRMIRTALEQGFKPDLITSDMSRFSIFRSPAYSLNYIMSEFLHFGFTFKELVDMFTTFSAKLIYGKADGFLKSGEIADLAIFRIMEKPVKFCDYRGDSFVGNRLIRCEETFKNGEPVFGQVDFTG